MGALEIRNKKLRCINCLDIRRLLIIPGYPDPKIEIMCHCNRSEESLLEYCAELKKITDFKLVCAKCGKEEIKHPRFCYECLAVYCSKCCNSHLPRITGDEDTLKRSSLVGHKTIHVEKLDFYCVNHQTENFIGYCQQCLMNICSQCYKEGTHQYHQVELFTVIKMDKKTKEGIKKSIKKAERKIEKSNKKIKGFFKKNKKNMDLKEIEEEFKICSEENEYILELMKYSYNLYDHSKNKNYSIIYNLIKNSKFNLKKLKIEKTLTPEEKLAEITKFSKKDFFILCKRNKNNTEEFEVENEEEQEEEDDEKDDDNNDESSIPSQVNTQNFSIRKISDQKREKPENKNNNIIQPDNNEIDNNIYQIEEQQNYNEHEPEILSNIQSHPQNNIVQQPKVEMKKLRMPGIFEHPPDKNPSSAPHMPQPGKLKMPSMFEKKEEEKLPEKPLPAMAKIKMPSMFDKKEENNKPKERAAIIDIGTSNMGEKQNLLKQMMLNKGGMAGKPKNPLPPTADTVQLQPVEEKIEIVHESNDAGGTAEVLNKVAVTQKKKKKPRRAQIFMEPGEENQEKPKPPPAPSTAQVLQNENNTQENNQEMHQETLEEKIVEQEQVVSQIQEEQKINENEINE